MIKKGMAVLLALALLLSAVPLVFAAGDEEVWLIYCAQADENSFTAIVVAPAKYTRISDPKIETIDTADPAGKSVSTPAAEQIRFYFDGRTETRWTLTVACAVPDKSVPGYRIKLAVLPGSVTDDAGNGNARVFFEDETEYMFAGGYPEIDVYSGLLLRDYPRADDTVAVGDTLRVDYSGLYPVEIFKNGAPVASLPGGEMQRYSFKITETGPLNVTVRQDGKEIAARSVTVISSAEMYERNLRDGLITGEDIPSSEDLIDVGVPPGSPFILVAKLIAFFNGLRIFFQRLFSFTRITE